MVVLYEVGCRFFKFVVSDFETTTFCCFRHPWLAQAKEIFPVLKDLLRENKADSEGLALLPLFEPQVRGNLQM